MQLASSLFEIWWKLYRRVRYMLVRGSFDYESDERCLLEEESRRGLKYDIYRNIRIAILSKINVLRVTLIEIIII
jgi:hypothetical protein